MHLTPALAAALEFPHHLTADEENELEGRRKMNRVKIRGQIAQHLRIAYSRCPLRP